MMLTFMILNMHWSSISCPYSTLQKLMKLWQLYCGAFWNSCKFYPIMAVSKLTLFNLFCGGYRGHIVGVIENPKILPIWLLPFKFYFFSNFASKRERGKFFQFHTKILAPILFTSRFSIILDSLLLEIVCFSSLNSSFSKWVLKKN